MRFVQPAVLLLGAAMYGLIIVFYDQLLSASTPWPLVIPGVWILLLLIATIITIVDGVLRFRGGKTRQLATDAMIAKFVAIPFFILNFYVLAEIFIFGGLTIAFGIGLAFWVVVAIGIGLTYLTMLSTSVYLWAAVARLRREHAIGTGLTVLYVILSLLFVTDIAAGVLVFGHSRRRPRLALALVLLTAGAVFLVFGIWSLVGLFGDGLGAGWNDPSNYLQWVIPVGLGGTVVVATVIVCVIRRGALRLEAQGAAAARRTPTESDASERVLVG